MFTKSPTTETKLDAEIQSALAELKSHDKTSDEYATLVEHISKLYKLKTEGRSKQISPDTVLIVAANLIGVIYLTNYERLNVVPKSAFSLLMRPR